MNTIRNLGVFLGLSTIAMTGCSSFCSSILGRGGDGKFSGRNIVTRSAGIPMKVKVPTHIEAKIVEKFFVDETKGVAVVPENARILDVQTSKVYSDQVVMVDIPRPFSGTLDMSSDGIKLDSDGYLTQIGATFKDTTIKDITKVLESDVTKIIQTEAKSKVRLDDEPDEEGEEEDRSNTVVLTPQLRVVAVERFDISNPGWQSAMNDWIERHMGNCNTTCIGHWEENCDCNNDLPVARSNPNGQRFYPAE